MRNACVECTCSICIFACLNRLAQNVDDYFHSNKRMAMCVCVRVYDVRERECVCAIVRFCVIETFICRCTMCN